MSYFFKNCCVVAPHHTALAPAPKPEFALCFLGNCSPIKKKIDLIFWMITLTLEGILPRTENENYMLKICDIIPLLPSRMAISWCENDQNRINIYFLTYYFHLT